MEGGALGVLGLDGRLLLARRGRVYIYFTIVIVGGTRGLGRVLDKRKCRVSF